MPLPFRTVEPVYVSRGTLPERIRIRNELEGAANGTLANVIRQLSSLSQGAEEIFGDLIAVGTEIAARANNLQARIDRLAVKVVQMDAVPEESTSMQDSLNSKPFISSMQFDQQVVTRQSLPVGMSKIYLTCDKPPPLDKLNKYRDDGRDGLKFYTDPSYFFELWRQDMLKDTERAIYDKGKKPHKPKHEHGQRHKKRVRQPHSTREKHRHVALEHGEHIMNRNNYHQDPREAGIYGETRHVQISDHVDYRHPNEQQYSNDIYSNNHAQPRYEAYTNGQHVMPNQQQQQLQHQQQQRYYPQQLNSPPPPYESPSSYARQTSTQRLGNQSINNQTNGYGTRPTQPPPAPPPIYAGTPPSSQSGTPTRNVRFMNNRETLPPPPPPPVETLQNGYTAHMNGYGHDPYLNHNGQIYDRSNLELLPPPATYDQNDEPLPPPPPTPDQNIAAMSMMAAAVAHHLRPPPIPDEHLPPSPPPPPPEDNFPPVAPPPPPPPPPMPVLANGNGFDRHSSPKATETTPTTTTAAAAPKRQGPPVGIAAWDGRSELLKAIRDGIELRKVERKEPGKEEKAAGMLSDVASILARRVAVEMSDSDTGSDSEYDSDGWADETSA